MNHLAKEYDALPRCDLNHYIRVNVWTENGYHEEVYWLDGPVQARLFAVALIQHKQADRVEIAGYGCFYHREGQEE